MVLRKHRNKTEIKQFPLSLPLPKTLSCQNMYAFMYDEDLSQKTKLLLLMKILQLL